MATYVLRSCFIEKGDFSNVKELRNFLISSIEVCVRRSDESILLYSYVEQDDMLCLKNPPEYVEGKIPPLHFFKTEFLFKEFIVETVLSISVLTRREFPKLFDIHVHGKFTDWARMITDLHDAKKIVVRKTSSILATDPRRFYFIGESEDTEIDVDFLGTKMSQEESDRVIEKWKKLETETLISE